MEALSNRMNVSIFIVPSGKCVGLGSIIDHNVLGQSEASRKRLLFDIPAGVNLSSLGGLFNRHTVRPHWRSKLTFQYLIVGREQFDKPPGRVAFDRLSC